jgi:hypothetical protein
MCVPVMDLCEHDSETPDSPKTLIACLPCNWQVFEEYCRFEFNQLFKIYLLLSHRCVKLTFDVLTWRSMKMCFGTLHSVVVEYTDRRFGGAYCLHDHVLRFCETSVNICRVTLCYIPQDSHFHVY